MDNSIFPNFLRRSPQNPRRSLRLARPARDLNCSPLALSAMIVAAARTSLMRSSSLRNPAAARIRASRASLRSPPKLRPAATPSRILRSPVETIFCVESLLPMHSATASALMTSMLAVSRRGYGWLSEAGNDDV